MKELKTKRRILEEAGYKYNFDRMVYFSKDARKVFSIEFVEDNDAQELRKCVNSNPNGGQWRFFFNSLLSDHAKDELARVLSQ